MQIIISKILPLLWLRISPATILESCFSNSRDGEDDPLHHKPNKRSLINAIIDFAPYYSEDEAENIQKMLFKRLGDRKELGGNKGSIFNLLIQVTDEMLTEKNGEPLCKYEKLLRWNTMSHKLGQDIFTTSYFAYRDCVMSNQRHYMAWSPIVRSNNVRIQTLLRKGLAENHFHLKGSSQIFDINWVSLMNDILHRHDTFLEMQASGRLSPIVLHGADAPETFYAEFKQAAFIRMFLFSQLNSVPFKDSFPGLLKKCLSVIEELETHTYEIHRFIDLLKYEFGRRLDKEKNGFGKVADYAIPKNLVDRNNNANLLLVGERKFLYDMFKEIYRGRNKQVLDYQDLFYAYLVIKARLRAELIQVNDRVGFKNFANYQDRKTLFIKRKSIFEKAVYKMAVDSTLHNQNICSLEARITPYANPMDLKKTINDIDSTVANEGLEQAKFSLPDRESSNKTKNGTQEENPCSFFYTLHFIKCRDKYLDQKYVQKLILSTIPRHHQKRNSVKKEAFAIAYLRETLNLAARRIFGIDAASNEIGCRPEVFAQAYRFLKDHAKKSDNEPILQEGIILPKLGATYHAGEDFLDIIDGLRAIDESVRFLNLTHGDRIGHALALGIDPWDWYRSKNKVLFLPMHDILDNTVWMLSRIREFNLTGYENLHSELESTFATLFYEIYEDNFNAKFIKQQYYSFDHNVFYKAWKLRGDNPELYSNGDFQEQTPFSFWERCNKNHFTDDKSIRKNRNAAFLYYCYHYNPGVKNTGNKQYEFIVSDDYIKSAVDIQAEMQKKVRDKGISIETNPTSNVLIGTFKRYDKHPIINFYNLGLESDHEKIKKCPQLSVSINTDDQGVFDTYLENEYSIMALALEEATDEQGNKLYTPAMIYDWLERIRQMGLEQSFCANV